MHQYVAHSMLPDGNYVFDFGDIFEGPLTRAGKGEEYKRTHPAGPFSHELQSALSLGRNASKVAKRRAWPRG